MYLIITKDTVLKKNDKYSITLGNDQKKKVSKLETLPEVKAYKKEGNYFIVTFTKNVPSDNELITYNTWYVFKEHCYIVKEKLLKNIIEVFLKKEYGLIHEGVNICGVENTDSSKENDKFNDQIVLFKFEEREGRVIGNYKATTQAGKYYTDNPLNKKGAAKLAFGQYKSWIIGLHQGKYEALVQLKPVKIYRDTNKTYQIDKGDYFEEGIFGINIHHAYSSSNIGKNSAGCQVIQNLNDFTNLLSLVKTDKNYKINKAYIFTYTLLNSKDFDT